MRARCLRLVYEVSVVIDVVYKPGFLCACEMKSSGSYGQEGLMGVNEYSLLHRYNIITCESVTWCMEFIGENYYCVYDEWWKWKIRDNGSRYPLPKIPRHHVVAD